MREVYAVAFAVDYQSVHSPLAPSPLGRCYNPNPCKVIRIRPYRTLAGRAGTS